MLIRNRRDLVFILLAGFFIANAILAELIGVKIITIGPLTVSVGVIAWPVVFISTDLINEYFGISGVRRLTFLTMGLITYCFLMIFLAMKAPAASFSPVSDEVFSQVFGQSLWIIVGSLTAFALSQLVDVTTFWFFRHRTGGKMLWLRSTGSTVISQVVDSFVVIGIAFWLPGKLSATEFLTVATTNYVYKLVIAIGMTPVIYGVHHLIGQFLGPSEAQGLINQAVQESD